MALLLKLQRFLPVVRVHVWGGLGSQLFALVTANRIQNKWPNRRITLQFHSSGVTQRFMELPAESMNRFKVIQKYDFNGDSSKARTLEDIRVFSRNYRKFLKFLLLRYKFLANLNTEFEFTKLRPWLVSVRGHYSGLAILPNEIRSIAHLLNLNIKDDLSVDESTRIHLRLGDLLNLANKSHIPIERISVLPEISKADEKVIVYSDSEVSIIESLWFSQTEHGSISFLSREVGETIGECIRSRIFIGTNSKISIWIAALRLGLNLGEKTFLPMELKHYTRTMFKEISTESEIFLY